MPTSMRCHAFRDAPSLFTDALQICLDTKEAHINSPCLAYLLHARHVAHAAEEEHVQQGAALRGGAAVLRELLIGSAIADCSPLATGARLHQPNAVEILGTRAVGICVTACGSSHTAQSFFSFAPRTGLATVQPLQRSSGKKPLASLIELFIARVILYSWSVSDGRRCSMPVGIVAVRSLLPQRRASSHL